MAEDKRSRGTSYVILAEGPGGVYKVVAQAEASNTEGALRQALAEIKDPDGTYVAIPARSFQPVPVRVKHVAPQLIIGDTPDPSPSSEEQSIGNGQVEPVSSVVSPTASA